MRTLAIIFISLLYSSSQLFAQLPDAKLKKMVVNHDIEALTQFNHKFKEGKPEEDGYKNIYKEFDKDGNVTKEMHYRQGEVSQRMTYKYDKKGNMTEFVNYSVRKDELKYRQTIAYNEDNNKVLENRYNGSEHFQIYYDYHENGKLAKIRKMKLIPALNKYELQDKRVFTHDQNVTTIKVMDPDDQVVKKIVNKYDDRGNLIEFNEYEPNGDRIKQISYAFNEDNMITKEEKYQKGNFIYSKSYDYDKEGNLVEVQKEQPEDKYVISKVYEYNKKNLAKEMWFDDMAEQYSHKKFVYNDDGILKEVEVYYALYQYRILYRFDYEYR